MADNGEDFDNPRDVELSSLTAIYPEIQQPNPTDKYTIALDVPVTPSEAVVVYFPSLSDDAGNINANANANANAQQQQQQQQQQRHAVDNSHELAHLPSIHLELAFGPDYPSETPPQITISTDPPWLPAETVKKLQDDGPRLWEDLGRDMVGFTYIDHIRQAAEGVFGLVDDQGGLEVDPRHKIAILDYDIQARKAAFEKETFECGVCLDPKKGSVCHRMLDCGHVFCVECLQDYYNNAIKEGDLAAVKCPAPNCARDRGEASGRKRKKAKIHISPSELLQIPIGQETVKRYVTLKYKTELESDKSTVYCPRPWCNGAARSKKHKKPQGLELTDVSDDSASEGEDVDDDGKPDNEGKSKPYKAAEELLAVCEDCNFAFCSRCMQSWHGEYVTCTPRRENGELTAEEKASLEYMKLHTTPCPTCAAPAQKTHGCNHMICYRCQTHFCYLCSAWLDPGNPYQHFNEAPNGRITSCYMRLWELAFGDGDDVGYGFAGGAPNGGQPVAPAADGAVPDHLLIPEIEEATDDEEEAAARPLAPQQAGAQPQNAPVDGGQVGIAREGPLVLRIAANQPARAGRGGPRGQAPAPAPAQVPRGGARGGGRGPQQQQAGRGGAGPQGGGRGRGGGVGIGLRGGRGEALPAQRGGHARRGGGRGGRGGGVGGPPHHRQNNNQAHQQQRRNAHNNQHQNQNQNGGGRVGVDVGHGGPELDPAHEAWVRQFVAMALNDEEDLFFEDFSDEE